MENKLSIVAEEMFEAFSTASSSHYIYMYDIESGWSRWSARAVEFFGLPGEYMYDVNPIWLSHIHPNDKDAYMKDIEAVFSGKKKNHELEYRAKDKDGNYVVCTCRGSIVRIGENQYFAGTLTNHGVYMHIDPVCNVYNVYKFLDVLSEQQQLEKDTCILQVAINHFADINDVYGYSFGNKVLAEFANMLLNVLDNRGKVFRMDGAKLAIGSNVLGKKEMEELYADIQSRMKKGLLVDGNRIPLMISGGMVYVDDNSIDANAIHTCLNYANATSKNKKHGELVIFDNDYFNDNSRTVEVINTMRGCIMNQFEGFYMCYQPIISAEDGSLSGMEALLRWNMQPYGEVPPGVFIPWLENDSLFFELGNWILERAMLDAKQFVRDNPDFVLNVNLSYTQLERSAFREKLLDILDKTQYPPENLCLELTERCRMLDLGFLKNEVIFLKSYGIKIALDDFGTGFTALNLLRDIPVDTIKLDRGFVAQIESNMADQVIVQAVTDCAKKLNILVCAEGIEEETMEACMKHYSVNSLQGYYYSKPVTLEQFMQLRF